MYLFDFITTNRVLNTVAIGDPKHLLNMCCMCDDSEHVTAWRIRGYSPNHFGWGFNPEQDKKCRIGDFKQEDYV